MEFFLLGEALTTDELYEAGLINALAVDPMEKAQEYAQAINKLSPLSSELIKKNIKASLDSNYSDSMERETSVQRFLGNSADYKEGLSAFLAKRQPQFTGQ
jgi:2-(1,2-epoxy-1,2-dihydrophenyl)acetyl-CoA isomerase